jgi:hypothetical protein
VLTLTALKYLATGSSINLLHFTALSLVEEVPKGYSERFFISITCISKGETLVNISYHFLIYYIGVLTEAIWRAYYRG